MSGKITKKTSIKDNSVDFSKRLVKSFVIL